MTDAVSLGEFQGNFMVDDNNRVKFAALTTRYYQVRAIGRAGETIYFSSWTTAVSGVTLAAGSTNATLQERMDTFAAAVQGRAITPGAVAASVDLSALSQAVSVLSQQISGLSIIAGGLDISGSLSVHTGLFVSGHVSVKGTSVNIVGSQFVLSASFGGRVQAGTDLDLGGAAAVNISTPHTILFGTPQTVSTTALLRLGSPALANASPSGTWLGGNTSGLVSADFIHFLVSGQTRFKVNVSGEISSPTIDTLSNAVSVLSQAISVVSVAVADLSEVVSALSQQVSALSDSHTSLVNRVSANSATGGAAYGKALIWLGV